MYRSSYDTNVIITFASQTNPVSQTKPSSHDNELIVYDSSITSYTTSFTDSPTAMSCSNQGYSYTYADGCHDLNATDLLRSYQACGLPPS